MIVVSGYSAITAFSPSAYYIKISVEIMHWQPLISPTWKPIVPTVPTLKDAQTSHQMPLQPIQLKQNPSRK